MRVVVVSVVALALSLGVFGAGPTPKEILTSFYNALDGPNWTVHTNWTSTTISECDWYGVACDASSEVTSIRLVNNGLKGEVPTMLSLLPLTNLNIAGNSISGSAAFAANMPRLLYLDVTQNLFTNSLPNLSNLTLCGAAHFGKNQFSGPIPTSISSMKYLTSFQAYENQLSGSIPSELTGLPRLSEIWMYRNALSGDVPDNWASPSLTHVDLSHNTKLTGAIPSSLVSLPQLDYLDLSYCNFTGNVTDSINKMRDASVCNLGHNDLNCPVASLPSTCGKTYLPQGNCSWFQKPTPSLFS